MDCCSCFFLLLVLGGIFFGDYDLLRDLSLADDLLTKLTDSFWPQTVYCVLLRRAAVVRRLENGENRGGVCGVGEYLS